MSRRRILLALAMASAVLTVPGSAALAVTGSVPAVPGSGVPRVDVSSVMDPQVAVGYWTAGKQSSADAAELPEHEVPAGGSERVGEPASEAERVGVPEDLRLTPGGDVNGYARMPTPYSRSAAGRATGRLFFLDADGGRRSCSGAVVRSSGGLLVATAAHCVYGVSRGTGRGVWSSNLAFVPAYDGNGEETSQSTPYGVWGVRRVWKPHAFTGVEPWNWNSVYDIALLEVGRRGSGTLEDAVGAFTPMLNQAGDYTIMSLGYPSDPPYDGTRQLWCLGRTTVAPGNVQPEGTAGRLHTANCHLFGGNSGGPWLDRSTGLLVGVLSSGAGDVPGDGYAVANPLSADPYGSLVRQADPRGVYDALSVRGTWSAGRSTDRSTDQSAGRSTSQIPGRSAGQISATVRMRGLVASARVPVTFRLPRGVRPAKGSPCAVAGRRVTCTIAVVRPDRPARVTVPVRGAAAGRKVTVSVAATFLDPDQRDNAHTFAMTDRGYGKGSRVARARPAPDLAASTRLRR